MMWPTTTAQPTMPVSSTEDDYVWFPVRITELVETGEYLFQEVWGIANGAVADRIGGRYNTAGDLAYAIDGSTFAVTQAGSEVDVFARRSPGNAGATWELKGFAIAAPVYAQDDDTFFTNLLLTATNTLVEVASISIPAAGTYFIWVEAYSESIIDATAGLVASIPFRIGLTGKDANTVVVDNTTTPNHPAKWFSSTVTLNKYVETTGAEVVKVYAFRGASGSPTWLQASFYITQFGFHRI